ncbi:hypothetical protein C8R47DRAFT_1063627 [Mycena vitilis]|nr:hypothetical protein C8R47DRAFT_1063627 [Mycena vitilis]
MSWDSAKRVKKKKSGLQPAAPDGPSRLPGFPYCGLKGHRDEQLAAQRAIEGPRNDYDADAWHVKNHVLPEESSSPGKRDNKFPSHGWPTDPEFPRYAKSLRRYSIVAQSLPALAFITRGKGCGICLLLGIICIRIQKGNRLPSDKDSCVWCHSHAVKCVASVVKFDFGPTDDALPEINSRTLVFMARGLLSLSSVATPDIAARLIGVIASSMEADDMDDDTRRIVKVKMKTSKWRRAVVVSGASRATIPRARTPEPENPKPKTLVMPGGRQFVPVDSPSGPIHIPVEHYDRHLVPPTSESEMSGHGSSSTRSSFLSHVQPPDSGFASSSSSSRLPPRGLVSPERPRPRPVDKSKRTPLPPITIPRSPPPRATSLPGIAHLTPPAAGATTPPPSSRPPSLGPKRLSFGKATPVLGGEDGGDESGGVENPVVESSGGTGEVAPSSPPAMDTSTG